MARATTVRLGWTHPVTEEEFEIRCSVTSGHEATRDEPADPGEVEVLEVADDQGASHPELVSLAQDTLDVDKAMDRAGDAQRARAEDFWDAQREERRSQLDRVMASIVGGR